VIRGAMSNQETVAHLTGLIAGDRIEKYYAGWCSECEKKVITADAKTRANAIKAQAAEIIVRLNDPDAAPDLWAQLVKDSPFDSNEAEVCRGEAQPVTAASGNAAMSRMLAKIAAGWGMFGGPEAPPPAVEYKNGFGVTLTEEMAAYRREARISGSRANPHGILKIEHHSECPYKPEPVNA
jgi:hypothetical protein